MEFAHVGAHCYFAGCNQQDFLPFQCEFCKDIHCLKHRRPDDHKCVNGGPIDDNYVIICPICELKLLLRGTGRTENAAEKLWNGHVDNGECQRQQEINS
jgi:hypothetical protein